MVQAKNIMFKLFLIIKDNIQKYELLRFAITFVALNATKFKRKLETKN